MKGISHAQVTARGCNHVEQKFEALGRKLRRELFEAVATNHEKPAHGIGNLDPQQPLGDRGRELAEAARAGG